MSLPHVLLGLLTKPASGYALRREIENSVRHFWPAELAQIYPTLSRLEQQGYLTTHAEPSDRGPPRKVYTRTETGRDALVDWLLQGPIVRTERLPYLTQVFFLDEVPMAANADFFRALSDDFRAHHQELLEVEAQWQQADPRYPDELPEGELYKQMTLRLGIRKYRLIHEWCQECLERLEHRLATAP